jgi:hypothetical protein
VINNKRKRDVKAYVKVDAKRDRIKISLLDTMKEKANTSKENILLYERQQH